MSTRLKDGRKDNIAELYEPHVAGARERFHDSSVVAFITEPTTDPQLLDRFLIQFCAQGVKMTEHVEQWILRAGRKTVDAGYIELGEALQRHAAQEQDHHLLMIDDTRSLVDLWNTLGRDRLDADELLASPATPGVRAYRDLHERVISGDTPYAQLGIEFEIEMLSTTVAVEMIANVAKVCGSDRVRRLSFLADHIELDVGHTEFNRRQLQRLLDDYPTFGGALGRAGSTALDSYRGFLEDCVAEVVDAE